MSLNLFSLEGKIALVTGSGRGIGRTLAYGLAEAGADLVVTEMPDLIGLAQESAAYIQDKLGVNALAVTLDITDISSIERAVEAAAERFGQIDILVNNAGMIIRKPSLEVTESDWDRVLDVNLKGAFFMSQAVGKVMKTAGSGGKIVNIASINGVVGFHERAAYCASKAGVVNITRVLAIDWSQYHINVNAVAPSYLLTPLTEKLFEQDDFRNDVLYRTPLKRIGKPEDIVGAVIYLASAASDYVTGQTICVDGGWTAW